MKLLVVILLFLNATPDLQIKPDRERLEYAMEVLERGIRDQDSTVMAEGYYLLGKRHAEMFDIEEAYRYYYQALGIHKQFGNHYEAGKIYLRMASMEMGLKNLKRALYYTKDALAIFEQHHLQKGIHASYKMLGEIYMDRNDDPDSRTLITRSIPLDSVLFYAEKSEQLILISGDEKELATIRFYLGCLYLEENNPKAIDNLTFAVNILEKYPPGLSLLNARKELARAEMRFGALENAGKTLARAQKIVDDGQNIWYNSSAAYYITYSEYHKASGNWEEALKMYEKAMNYSRQIVQHERNQNINRWRIRLETEKKELELKLQEKELESHSRTIALQKLMILLSVISLVLLGTLSYFLYQNYRKQQQLSRKNAFLIREQNHRVKNNLQVISSILSLQQQYLTDAASRNALSESQARIDSVVMLHRQLYENTDFELIDMEQLFDDIITSVAITFGEGFVDSELDMEEKYLEPDTATSVGVIVNELIVNSFKYAFRDNPPKIYIRSRAKRDKMEITYQDFGTFNLEDIFRNPERKGFGLQLIDLILKQINGKLTYSFQGGSVFVFTFNHRVNHHAPSKHENSDYRR